MSGNLSIEQITTIRNPNYPKIIWVLVKTNDGLEGMASGKQLILSDIPGVRDVISSEEGFIVEPLDPEALAEALEKIWSYPENAKQMGLKGRERVVSMFSWKKVSKDVEKIFKEI